jgi:hypothetical protein
VTQPILGAGWLGGTDPICASCSPTTERSDDGHEPADVTTCLRRDLMSYQNSSAGQPVRQLLQDRMDGGDSTERRSRRKAAETEMR